jgi:ClpX C4-type zinc finger
MSKVGDSDSKNTLYCSFCGKSQREVRKQQKQLFDYLVGAGE